MNDEAKVTMSALCDLLEEQGEPQLAGWLRDPALIHWMPKVLGAEAESRRVEASVITDVPYVTRVDVDRDRFSAGRAWVRVFVPYGMTPRRADMLWEAIHEAIAKALPNVDWTVQVHEEPQEIFFSRG